MNASTKVLLVLLRLAIGWHLLFAGVVKFKSDYRGSEGYLQEASGPAAPVFHWMAGERFEDRFAVRPLPDDAGKDYDAADHFPKAVANEWEDFFNAFASHYGLDSAQRATAQQKMKQSKDVTARWMATGKKSIQLAAPWDPPVETTKTIPEWVALYKAKRKLVYDAQTRSESATVASAFASEKAQAAKIRGDLTRDLESQTKQMKQSLESILTEEQKTKPPMADAVAPSWGSMKRIDWVDFMVRWTLVLVGACLLLGFCTRLNCIAAAVLLLSFFLAVPPLPGMPEPLRIEGWPFVNKNLIEALALLTLATTRSGRWAGIDGLLYYFNPFRRKTPDTRQVVPGRVETFTPFGVAPVDSSTTARATSGSPR